MATYTERCGGGFPETASIEFKGERVDLVMGNQEYGTGLVTSYKQVVSDRLGIDADRIDVVYGDTDRSPRGLTGGSRALPVGGSALHEASLKIIDKGKQIAANLLEASAADIEYGDGEFRIVGTDRHVDLFAVAEAAKDPAKLPPGMTPGLDTTQVQNPTAPTFPNGCHIAEVEIDPDSGVTTILRYTVVDDFGAVINPLLLEGQVHGGVVQGIGQALLEETVYDGDSGQLLSGTFMDYAMPRADNFAELLVHHPQRTLQGQSARRQRRGRGRRGRLAAGGDQRDRRRIARQRRQACRHAGNAEAGVGSFACRKRMSIPDDALGAFCRENHIAVKGVSVGPLAGLTFAAKDAFNIAGARTGFGQPDWLRTHGAATETADAVTRLLGAGADMVGKTHCDELCYSLTGENVHFGTPVNINAPGRVPGGSSNGSAAAVAGKTGRLRARHRLRRLGAHSGELLRHHRAAPDPWARSATRAFCRSVRASTWSGGFARHIALFETVGNVLLGADKAAAPTRLIIADDAWAQVEAPVADALKPAAGKVEAVLGKAAHMNVSPEGLTEWFEVFRTLQAAEIWATLGEWVSATQPKFGPGTRERFAYAATITPAQVDAANARRRAIRAHLDDLLGTDGVICVPTSPRVAPLRGTPADQVEVEYRNQAQRILCIAGLCGLPQISLPMAAIDGLPLGLSLIGTRGSDKGLIAQARR